MGRPESKVMFSKVSTRSDRERAYGTIVENSGFITVRLKKIGLKDFVADNLQGGEMELGSREEFSLDGDEVIATFSVGSEKYFILSSIRRSRTGRYLLDITPDLYKLQRRDQFRVILPETYGARFEDVTLNGEPIKEKLTVSDISGGGCAIDLGPLNKIELKTGDRIKGKLVIGNKFNDVVSGEIRYSRTLGSRGSGLKRAGLMYMELSALDQDAMVKVAMDIYRDLFSRFKLGQR